MPLLSYQSIEDKNNCTQNFNEIKDIGKSTSSKILELDAEVQSLNFKVGFIKVKWLVLIRNVIRLNHLKA